MLGGVEQQVVGDVNPRRLHRAGKLSAAASSDDCVKVAEVRSHDRVAFGVIEPGAGRAPVGRVAAVVKAT